MIATAVGAMGPPFELVSLHHHGINERCHLTSDVPTIIVGYPIVSTIIYLFIKLFTRLRIMHTTTHGHACMLRLEGPLKGCPVRKYPE